MMELHNEKYFVASRVEDRPALEGFDFVYNTEEVNTDDFYSARVLQVTRNDGHGMSVALLDFACSRWEPYAILSDNILTVILFSAIVQIDLDSGAMIRCVECSNMGGLLEIHPISNGYIICGEGDIFRYDVELNQIWRFSGRDMFASQTDGKSFRIDNDVIHCTDWEGRHYMLDFDGKLIRETPAAEIS